MSNYKMDAGWGHFDDTAKKAKDLATERNFTVEFEFNGTICVVDNDTNLEWLFRDYCNANRMEWKEVGANCVAEYSPEIKAELERRNKISDEKEAERQREYKIKEDKEKADFAEKVKGLQMEFKNKDAWDRGLSVNTDPYGGCVYEYAEGWAKLMQREILNGKKVHECAEKTSFELGFLGITGFMYGAAVSVLSECWLYGEQLRKWHNKEYNHEGDGVVNPAILTISTSN